MTQEPMKLVSKRLEIADSIEAFNQLAADRGWSDGLPAVPPTEERVTSMIEYVRRDPQSTLGAVPPAYGEATIERLAVNAVMAGCLPPYFPVMIAAVEAMLTPDFNLAPMQTTTNPVAPLLIVNGPVRKSIALNCGTGVFGPGWQANATIGRAIRLILLNVGGAVPGSVSRSTQAQPAKYGLCIGENEEESPWPPLHVDLGFDKGTSTVTVVGVTGTVNVLSTASPPEALLQQLVNSMKIAGSNNVGRGKGPIVVVVSPDHALTLKKAGYSKEDVQKYLHANSKVPSTWLHQGYLDWLASTGGNKPDADGMLSQSRDFKDFTVVVAGGVQGYHSTVLPSFAAGVEAVTREIAVPRGT